MVRTIRFTFAVLLMSVASAHAQMMPPPNPYPPARYSFQPRHELRYYRVPRADTAVLADAALINLTVPANAEVWFSGEQTTSTGSERTFVTPSLEPGHRYAYDIRIRWMENGQPRERVQKVRVHPGDRLNLSID